MSSITRSTSAAVDVRSKPFGSILKDQTPRHPDPSGTRCVRPQERWARTRAKRQASGRNKLARHPRRKGPAMAVGLRIKFPGGTQEQYIAVHDHLDIENRPPRGLI